MVMCLSGQFRYFYTALYLQVDLIFEQGSNRGSGQESIENPDNKACLQKPQVASSNPIFDKSEDFPANIIGVALSLGPPNKR